MINNLGVWAENTEQTSKEKWCDMDYIAEWIRSCNYTIETDIENLINMILVQCEELEEIRFNNNHKIIIDCIIEFVVDRGGLKEFDYYC